MFVYYEGDERLMGEFLWGFVAGLIVAEVLLVLVLNLTEKEERKCQDKD